MCSLPIQSAPICRTRVTRDISRDSWGPALGGIGPSLQRGHLAVEPASVSPQGIAGALGDILHIIDNHLPF
jgi:hypothetical protein